MDGVGTGCATECQDVNGGGVCGAGENVAWFGGGDFVAGCALDEGAVGVSNFFDEQVS